MRKKTNREIEPIVRSVVDTALWQRSQVDEPDPFINTQQEANACCEAAIRNDGYYPGDIVLLDTGEVVEIMYSDGRTKSGSDPWITTYVVSNLPPGANFVMETQIIGLWKDPGATASEIARALAMISSLTYAEALDDMNEGIKAMKNSHGACEALFNLRMQP